MSTGRLVRIVGVVAALLAAGFFISTTVSITTSIIELIERLRGEPLWVQVLAGGVALLGIGLTLTLLWWLLRPATAKTKAGTSPVLNEDSLIERLEKAAADGVDVAAAKDELALRERSAATLDVAVFGEISAGKSSLIRALLPEADVESSPLGGTTVTVNAYRWRSPADTDVRLLDLPGMSGVGSDDAPLIEEARRAHVVLFVCDTDLTRADLTTVEALAKASKPMLVALNKADQYAADELRAVLARIHERVLGLDADLPATVIPAIAGGREQVIERSADGDERSAERERQPDIDQLVVALNHLVSNHAPELIRRRDQALFQLAGDKLRAAELAYRTHRGEEIVRSHTAKAVVGALAAVSPGADIVIQGYLGTSLVRELCRLNDVAVNDVDIDQFLDLSQSRVGRAIPLALAVAGNALKAFPGLGTIGGGAMHAIAYGLIFDALGRGLVKSLAEKGDFDTGQAADNFAAELNTRLENRVARIAKIAVAEIGRDSR
ncbi:MAG: GTPase [Pseudomonadota bacterium]